MKCVCILSDKLQILSTYYLQIQSTLQRQLPIIDANKYISKSLLTTSCLVVDTHA